MVRNVAAMRFFVLLNPAVAATALGTVPAVAALPSLVNSQYKSKHTERRDTAAAQLQGEYDKHAHLSFN